MQIWSAMVCKFIVKSRTPDHVEETGIVVQKGDAMCDADSRAAQYIIDMRGNRFSMNDVATYRTLPHQGKLMMPVFDDARERTLAKVVLTLVQS